MSDILPPDEPSHPAPGNPHLPPPGDPWYRRYWLASSRPFSGCGIVYLLLLVVIVVWLLSFAWPG